MRKSFPSPRRNLRSWFFTVLQTAGLVAALAVARTAAADSSAGEQKVESLLAQMSLDEKIGQMIQADLLALTNKSDIEKYCLGSVLSGGSSDPANGNSARAWLEAADSCEQRALKTRLKIPLLYGIDAVHGHNNVEGAVIFPHNIGMGATRNPALVEKEERVTAEEMSATGIRWAFAPCVAVARDERWGRTYESFGQSPELVSELGAAAVRGFQGTSLSDPASVLACAKHYLGDGGTRGGVDQGNVICDEATLRKLFLPPYAAAVKAAVGSIMVSYSSWNGEKMSANKHLLTDVLKGELGFKGFLVSDWAAIDQLSPDYKKDIETSINAGLDMIMIPNGPGKPNNYVEFAGLLKQLVEEKRVPQSRIDDAARRILREKFALGLFEHPFADHALLASVGSPEHRQVARQCVRESLVLLKNENHALPLSKNLKRLCIVGRGADNIGIQCGGWTVDWQGSANDLVHGGTTILDGIRKAVTSGAQVSYSSDGAGAEGADAVIVVVGELPYAETKGDRQNLDLSEDDLAVIGRVKKAGIPVITVVLSGRPLVLGRALDESDALIAAWLPGTEGEGVADVLFGDYKPTGKLPRAWPRDNSQLSAAAMESSKPLFPYGFGLSY